MSSRGLTASELRRWKALQLYINDGEGEVPEEGYLETTDFFGVINSWSDAVSTSDSAT